MKTFSEFIKVKHNEEKEEEENMGYTIPNISYAEYLAENLGKNIQYGEYLAENLDKSIGYSEYIAEALDKNLIYDDDSPKITNAVMSGITTAQEEWINSKRIDKLPVNYSNIRKYLYIVIEDDQLLHHLNKELVNWQLTIRHTTEDRYEEVYIGESLITGEKIYRINHEFFTKTLYTTEKQYLLNRFTYLSGINASVYDTLNRMNKILNIDEISDVLNSLPDSIPENVKTCYINSAKTYGEIKDWEIKNLNHGTTSLTGSTGCTNGLSGSTECINSSTGLSGSTGNSGTSAVKTNQNGRIYPEGFYTDGWYPGTWQTKKIITYDVVPDPGFSSAKMIDLSRFAIRDSQNYEFIGTNRITGLPLFKKNDGSIYQYEIDKLDTLGSLVEIYVDGVSPERELDHPEIKSILGRFINFFWNKIPDALYRFISNKLFSKNQLHENAKVYDYTEFSKNFYKSIDEFKEFEKLLIEPNKINENEN